jgi:hypothetical protein
MFRFLSFALRVFPKIMQMKNKNTPYQITYVTPSGNPMNYNPKAEIVHAISASSF